MFTTKIGKVAVPVRDAHKPSLVWFDAGEHGKQFGERGIFAFWAAIQKTGTRKERKIWGRSLVAISCGDRFDRMQYEQNTAKTKEDRAIYGKMWNDRLKQGRNIAYIRPCTFGEIADWAQTHYTDAKFIKWCILNGNYYQGGFELISVPAVKWKTSRSK